MGTVGVDGSWSCRLLSPNEDLRSAAIGLIEHQPRASTLEVFQGQVHAIGIEVDPVVVEERYPLARGREPQQPERNRDAHELSRWEQYAQALLMSNELMYVD